MVTFTSIFGRSRKAGWLVLAVVLSHPVLARAQNEITLTVSFVGGGDTLDFGRLRNLEKDGTPAAESATRQVRLNIQPVGGSTKPYIVTQILQQDPTNQTGGSAASTDSILYRVQEETGSGTVRVPSQTPLAAGEEEIYRSNPSGGESQLLITYDLGTSPDQEAGSYTGAIMYRVSTL